METRAFNDIARYDASGNERLAELAAFLDGVPADRLTFTRWYGDGKGCAVGLAAAHNPWFQAQGLRLEQNGESQTCWPVYGGLSDRVAVAKFFGLDQTQLNELLDPVGYEGSLDPHPRSVAGKIRAFLAEKVLA